MTINTHTFEAIKGRQAGNDFYIAMCSLKSASKLFTFKDADIPAEQRAQRILRKARIPKIRDYILQNPDDYTFSSITVSVDGKITFESISKNYPNIGAISISQDAAILINDGQHRIAAIKESISENADLGKDKLSVVFFEDLNLTKSQQMFADLNKHAVKPTKSLGILYDKRNEFATFVVDMVKKVKIFRNRIEMENTSISHRATKFFTLSGVELATKQLLGNPSKISKADQEIAIRFWNNVAKNIPEWNLLMEHKITTSELRKNFVHASTNVLESIAIAGNTLIKNNPKDWNRNLAGLQKIDWSRTNSEWEGSIILNGKMTKTKQGMKNASKTILKYCRG